MSKHSRWFEFLRYLFWAAATTGVSWLSYTAFANLFRIFGMPDTVLVTVSNVLSWICAVTFSYLVNRLRVFHSAARSAGELLSEAAKFYGFRLAVGVVEMGSVPFLVWLGVDGNVLGAKGMVAKMISTPLIILLNYLIGRFFVFRKQREARVDAKKSRENT